MTQKQIEEHTAASRRGAIEGTILGGSIAFASSYWGQRRLPAYRNLPLSLKALGVIIVTAPLLSIQAERRGLEYDRSQWYVKIFATTTNSQVVVSNREGAARELMDEKEFEEETRWQKLSLWDKIGDWSYRHQYSLIMGSWATSLAVAGTIISRNEFVARALPNFFLILALVQVSDLSSKDRTGSYVGSRIDDRSPYRRRCTHSF